MAQNAPPDANIEEDQAKSAANQVVADPAVLAAVGSVLLSLYTYYVQGHEQRGIFIGHWAPTFLAFAIYLRQKNIDERIEQAR